MIVRARLLRGFLLSWSLAVGAASLAGCHKDKAEIGPTPDSLKQSYEALKPELNDLKATLSGLHARVEALPKDVPNLRDLYLKLANAEEVLGVTDSRIRWLAGELDAAVQGKKKEQLQAVSKAIADTRGDMWKIAAVGLELRHQLLPFEGMAAGQPKTVRPKPAGGSPRP